MKRLIMSVWCMTLVALRDPFFYPDGKHTYRCLAIGLLNSKPILATIAIDGIVYTVHLGERVLDHEVIVIDKVGITLKDPEGIKHSLIISHKKRPFNLGKLKG